MRPAENSNHKPQLTSSSPMNALLQQFQQTRVNTQTMQAYLLGVPRYYECGLETGVHPYARRLLYRTDCVEFDIRQYIAGQTTTLRSLNRQIRQFLALDERAGRTMTAFALCAVEKTLLDQELYEVMPRFKRLCQRIHHTFAIKPLTPSR
jgi:hypothetical protein